MNQTVIEIPPLISRQYLVKGQNGFLLIDVGLRFNYAKLVGFLKRVAVPISSIELIVVTHADGDHFGCLSRLQELSSSLISATSETEAAAISLGKSSRKINRSDITSIFFAMAAPLFISSPARIDRVLSTGEELPYLGGLEILDSSGHTPGHISLWSNSTRTLFSGDSIKIKGKHLSPSSGANTWDKEKACASFERQIALQPDRIFAGHGTWQRE